MERKITKIVGGQVSSNEVRAEARSSVRTTTLMPQAFKDPLLNPYKVGSRFKQDPPEEGHIVIQLDATTDQPAASASTPAQAIGQTQSTSEAPYPPQRMDFAAVAGWLEVNDIMEPYVEPAADAQTSAQAGKQSKRASYSTMAAWNDFHGVSGSNQHARSKSKALDPRDVRRPFG